MTLLEKLRDRGVELWLERGTLAFDESNLTQGQVAWLLSKQNELVIELKYDDRHWRDTFEERLAIVLEGGDISREQARAIAWDQIITEWLNANPAPSSRSDGCAHCGGAGGVLLPYGTNDCVTWLHDECWTRWSQEREVRAKEALAQAGIEKHPPMKLGNAR